MLRIVTYFGELRSREGGCADDEFLESATLAPADIPAQPSFGMVVSWPISGVGDETTSIVAASGAYRRFAHGFFRAGWS